jgi:lipopolysaccharide biosynthesis glycosyltransferase
MRNLNVLIACDGKYVPHAATCIASILTNSSDYVSEISLILAGTAQRHKSRLKKWCKRKFKFELNMVDFDIDKVSGLETKGYISSATYIRYFLPSFVPHKTHVLYLDADTIVTGPLKDISNIACRIEAREMGCAPVYAVSDEDRHRQIPDLKRVGLASDRYFNAGVMLIDLEIWKSQDTSAKLVEHSTRLRGQLNYMDQDCLNLIYQEDWGELSWLNNQHGSKFDPKGSIVHFTGEKPTALGNRHPARNLYWRYRRMTPYWISIPELPYERYLKEAKEMRYKVQRALNRMANLLGIRLSDLRKK